MWFLAQESWTRDPQKKSVLRARWDREIKIVVGKEQSYNEMDNRLKEEVLKKVLKEIFALEKLLLLDLKLEVLEKTRKKA